MASLPQGDELRSSTPSPSPQPPAPTRRTRGRARSASVRQNPLAVPLTTDEQAVANLINLLNRSNPAPTQGSSSRSSSRRPSPSPGPPPTPRLQPVRDDRRARVNMSYQNYADSPGGGQPSNRQAPPSPSQGMNHANGMNGGMSAGGGMVGFPTPAGHQSDLNYIMQMVEDLSRQLETNQRITSNVMEKIGQVRERAKNMDLNNDELIALVASEMNDDTKNLEKEISELRKKLDKSEHDRIENWKLVVHGCNILSDILEKMHKFKEQHEKDTLAWHKNYRQQLATEREENLNLRNQIIDMKAAACRANEHLRGMRRYLTDHDERTELRIQNIALRQEKRSWKRMALKHLPDDDSEFSDDDDIIDPEEKKRVAAEAAAKAAQQQENNEGGGGSGSPGDGPGNGGAAMGAVSAPVA